MIEKNKVRGIAINYLRERKREYLDVDSEESVSYIENKKVLYGEYEGELKNVYTIEYSVQWGLEEKGMLIYIDAETGEVLYSISPTSWIEELEEMQGKG